MQGPLSVGSQSPEGGGKTSTSWGVGTGITAWQSSLAWAGAGINPKQGVEGTHLEADPARGVQGPENPSRGRLLWGNLVRY